MVRITSKTEEKKPSFYKIVFYCCKTEELRIPPNVGKHMLEELTDRASLKLEDSSDYSWTVKVHSATTGGVYFKDGCPEFLKDNSLVNGEILILPTLDQIKIPPMLALLKDLVVDQESTLPCETVGENLPSAEGSGFKKFTDKEEDCGDNAFENSEASCEGHPAKCRGKDKDSESYSLQRTTLLHRRVVVV
ncbi:hypothetical protein FF1_034605 [Malus domestica]